MEHSNKNPVQSNVRTESGWLAIPLFVDLDNSLVRTDLLQESIALLLRRHPLQLWRLPIWLLNGGRSGMKARLAERCTPNPEILPYNESLLSFLREEHQNGRPLVLATASNERIGNEVAKQLGLFSAVLATTRDHNLKGLHKLAAIQEFCRLKGWTQFGYVGDSPADVPIWKASTEAYIVGNSKSLLAGRPAAGIFDSGQRGFRSIIKALRAQHWAKNILIFAPLIAAHKVDQKQSVVLALSAFLCFNLTASAVYIFNDILDVENDRRHPTKRRRPFASGSLSLGAGLVLALGLLAVAVFLAFFWLPAKFPAILLAYLASTFAYSLYLKRKLLVDVIALALLYTIRIIAGAMVISVALSSWFMIFSFFLFMSLAFAKRHSELHRLLQEGSTQILGRAYRTIDLPVIQNIGGTCGCLAVLVLAMYINSEQVAALYPHPQILWGLCLGLLYWIGRIWFFAARGELPEDAIVFALGDWKSYLVAILCAVAGLIACWP